MNFILTLLLNSMYLYACPYGVYFDIHCLLSFSKFLRCLVVCFLLVFKVLFNCLFFDWGFSALLNTQ